jgi:hypothetical protein
MRIARLTVTDDMGRSATAERSIAVGQLSLHNLDGSGRWNVCMGAEPVRLRFRVASESESVLGAPVALAGDEWSLFATTDAQGEVAFDVSLADLELIPPPRVGPPSASGRSTSIALRELVVFPEWHSHGTGGRQGSDARSRGHGRRGRSRHWTKWF